MPSPSEQSSQPRPLRPCPFIRSLKDIATDSNHGVNHTANAEPPLKSSPQSLISPSQTTKSVVETLSEDNAAPAASKNPIIMQSKCPLCGCSGATSNTQSGTVSNRKTATKHIEPKAIGVIIDLICQLIDFTVVRVDVIFVQDLSSTLSVPESIQSAIDRCSTAKKIQLTPTDSITLSTEASLPRIVYTMSSSDYLQYIKDIGQKTRSFATDRLNGILIRPNVCIPPALLNWSLPVVVANNKIKREENANYKYNIDPLTPNLHALKTWQREAIEFYLLRGGKCILADPPEMGVAAQALLSVYQHRNSFPLFIIAHANSISYWKEQVYLWYNDDLTRSKCMSQWLEEKASHEAKTNSLQKSALKRSSGSESRVIKRTRLRRIYEQPSGYSLNSNNNCAIYALGYEDITTRGAFSEIYTHAVQTCFEGVVICKKRMIVVLTIQNFLALYGNGLVHPQLSTFVLSDAQEYKDMSSKRTKELSLILSACPHIVACTSIANIGFVRAVHPQLTILGLSIGKIDFLTRYCEMKKRELSGGKVVITASGMSMHDELAYIFRMCCLSRLPERYIGAKRRFILCLENERDAHTDEDKDSDILIDLHESNIALAPVVDALVSFYAINSTPFILVVHGKETASMLVDDLNNRGIKVDSIGGKKNIDTSMDCIHRLQSNEIAALICIDDGISVRFTITRTCICLFVGLSWSSSEISAWESKLQVDFVRNKQQYSIFITDKCNKSVHGSEEKFFRNTKSDSSQHSQPSDFPTRENFITNLLHSWKVPKWNSYPRILLSTFVSKHIEGWFSN